MASISHYSSQWKELRIGGCSRNSALRNSILSLPSSSIPNLQYLEIPQIWETSREMYNDKKNFLGGPSIRGFRYQGVYDDGWMKMPLQWSQLTDLHIASMKATDTSIRKILAECPRLERCHICTSFALISDPYPLSRLLLPHLTLLHIHHIKSAVPPTGFFASLHLPSLEDLTLYTPFIRLFLPVLLGESLATLRRLTVWTSHYSTATETMLETLALTTQLEFLEIGYLSNLYAPYTLLSDTFLAALTPRQDGDQSASPITSSGSKPQHTRLMDGPDSSSYLCPNLQAIKLRIGTGTIAEDVIFDFIKGRRERSTTLRSVGLIYARYAKCGEREMQGVDVLGVKVNIKYRDRAK
ncbi:hypothetical protein D9611_002937 [Ephemerocybe angulata]|uniref:Uncharacterized protein n=1 Tax=Ephemerocybe angulata TaxID=980116 RepID=A0A8H5C8S8_9AGAR|nr:hypothetical protein D9611_002937 [Tulosesus angulatus]